MNVINQDAFAKIAVNKSLLKEYSSSKYSRVVYLNNGDEFQIQLFNSRQYLIAAKIFMNGEELSDMLVLRPGERVWLERYFDNPRKFKFSTYEIENSPEAKAAASLNGEVKVEFYRVKTKKSNPIVWVYPRPEDYVTVYYDNNISSDLSNLVNNVNTASTSRYNSVDSISTSTGGETAFTCSCMDSVNSCATSISYSSTPEPKGIETGRVEKGAYSNQKFSYVDYDFENYPFMTEKIDILPLSRKPYTSSDLKKRYCSNCGRKLSPKHKYCPYCGTEVE